MDYYHFVSLLESKKDDKLASFSKKLSNSDYLFYGIKIPELRKIIKDIKQDKELDLKVFILGNYFEIDFIYFGLSLIKINDIDMQLSFIQKEIHKAKSWMVTDSVPSFISKYDFDTYFSFFLKTYNSKEEYERRISYVLGLKLSKEKEILSILEYMNKEDTYIVEMAKAWLLATIAITYPKEVYDFVSKIKSSLLKRKTISKIIESFRISDLVKNGFKKLRH